MKTGKKKYVKGKQFNKKHLIKPRRVVSEHIKLSFTCHSLTLSSGSDTSQTAAGFETPAIKKI